jgi:hypothetical protein
VFDTSDCRPNHHEVGTCVDDRLYGRVFRSPKGSAQLSFLALEQCFTRYFEVVKGEAQDEFGWLTYADIYRANDTLMRLQFCEAWRVV